MDEMVPAAPKGDPEFDPNYQTVDAFDGLVAQAHEDYPECTDGGGIDHYRSLVALGYCPHCDLEVAP